MKIFSRTWIHKLKHWRDLVFQLVVRDLKIQYKRSSIGILWSLVNPLLQLLVFGFIFKSVLRVNVPRFSAYAFTGMLIFSWLSASIVLGARAITGNRDLIRRPGFPSAILPVVAVASNLVHFLLALPILFIFLFAGDARFGSALLFLPLLILIQFVISTSLAYMVGALNVVFRDTQHILGILLQLLLFVTPIFFSAAAIPAQFQWVVTFNPLSYLVDAYRAVLLQAMLPDFGPVLIITAVALVLLAVSYRLFVRMSYQFAEEL